MLSIRTAWKFSNNKAVNVFLEKKNEGLLEMERNENARNTNKSDELRQEGTEALNAETCVNSWHTLSFSMVLFLEV